MNRKQRSQLLLIGSLAGLLKSLRRYFTTVATCILVIACDVAAADDTELYEGLENTPKVLFVLDVSGSMGRSDSGHSGTRMERLKEALTALLSNLHGIDVGLMSYSGHAIRLLHEVTNVSEERAELLSIVDGLRTGGTTPTVSVLYEASLYMRGERAYLGSTPDGSGQYQSPLTSECESSHVVVLTDGRPYSDTANQSLIELQYGLSCSDESNSSATCGVELADYLVNNNQINGVPNSNITTHSIGFNLTYDWVERVADAGNGIYRDAESAQDLIDAFNDILNSVEIEAGASAPSISVSAFNESRHSDKVYYSVFQPTREPRWDGNVKKYRLLNGEIVDRDDNPILDTNGELLETSRSFWADTDDGRRVSDGGMAARQPAGRTWYTDAGVAPANGVVTPRLVTRYRHVDRTFFGAASNLERNRLIDWVRGYEPANPTQPSYYVADSLHNNPVVVTYQADEGTGILEEVVFSANNMGVLHAVDAETGAELWSYTPQELLPNVKAYLDNQAGGHIYGLDGPVVAHSTRQFGSSLDYELEKAWLYLSQRRGGNGIFALDVTNATQTSNPLQVLWKINGGVANTDFRDLGQTWATPQIIPIKYGCPDACETKEVLMFGGGYNPVYDDKNLTYPVTPSATGHGNAIYMVDPETGALIWSAGNGAHHDLDLPMNDSIPTTPVPIDTNADGVVDLLMVSDIAGHIWRIDLQKEAGNASDLALGGGVIAALNEAGQAQRFFNRVDVVINGTTQDTAFFNIVLGSGMRSSPLYNEPLANRLYIIKDPWVFSYPPGDDIDAATGEPLPDYNYVESTSDTEREIRSIDLWQHGTTVGLDSRRFGYYRIFNEPGEKILQPTLTHSGRVFAVSYVPPDPATRLRNCNYDVGESRLHILDLADGSNTLAASFQPFHVVGPGIISIGSIVDTGDGSGLNLLTGSDTQSVTDLIAPANPDVFRRFFRTGWLEKDDY